MICLLCLTDCMFQFCAFTHVQWRFGCVCWEPRVCWSIYCVLNNGQKRDDGILGFDTPHTWCSLGPAEGARDQQIILYIPTLTSARSSSGNWSAAGRLSFTHVEFMLDTWSSNSPWNGENYYWLLSMSKKQEKKSKFTVLIAKTSIIPESSSRCWRPTSNNWPKTEVTDWRPKNGGNGPTGPSCRNEKWA